MTTYTKENYIGAGTSTSHDFGLLDNKGRAVGARVYLGKSEFVVKDVQDGNGCSRAPGVYFSLSTSATRAGAPFGAGQYNQYYATEAARDVAIAKYLKGAAARARKAWGAK